MAQDNRSILRTLNPNKIWIPILFSLAIVVYMFYSDDSITANDLKMAFNAEFWAFLLAVLLILARGIAYMYRIRVISDRKLSWDSAFYVILLWEFASAVTPSVVGGTAVVAFIMMKEGISLGKSLAYVMITAILDNLFFVIAALIALVVTGGDIFPTFNENIHLLGMDIDPEGGLEAVFYISFSLILLYTFLMFYALFIKPRAFKWFLLKVTSIKFLKKWQKNANTQGNEIIQASAHLKGKPFGYWFNISFFTIIIWAIRYLQLNVLVGAFIDLSFLDHIVIFSRQIILWVVMLLSPTPGSSGTAELFFVPFFKEFLGSYTLVTNILWRALSYYPYLILGAIFLPRWVKRVFFKKNKKAPQTL